MFHLHDHEGIWYVPFSAIRFELITNFRNSVRRILLNYPSDFRLVLLNGQLDQTIVGPQGRQSHARNLHCQLSFRSCDGFRVFPFLVSDPKVEPQ